MNLNFKFGKLAQRVDKRTIQLKTIFMMQNLPPLPISYDVDSEFSGFSDKHMYGNDIYGDCVMAGRGHMTLRFEDFEQNKLISITDKEIENEYFKETGGGDDGLVMLDSLNLWRKSGWIAAGQNYTIYAYAQLDIKNHNELMYSVYLLRGGYVGFDVPQSAMDQFNAGKPWTIVSNDGGIVGGHCVYIVGYNQTGPVCVTWGQKQQMSWAFWDKYFTEAYAVIDNIDSWMNPATDPVNIATLQQELNDITTNPVPPPIPTWTLNVVSVHDTPSPTVGSHIYNDKIVVLASVTSPIVENGISYTCTGWTGKGSVPINGTATSEVIVMSSNSTITWNWIVTPTPPAPPTPPTPPNIWQEILDMLNKIWVYITTHHIGEENESEKTCECHKEKD